MLCVAGAGLPTRLSYNASATQLQTVLGNLATAHNYINTEFPPRTTAQVTELFRGLVSQPFTSP
jgi:hypothetical protein